MTKSSRALNCGRVFLLTTASLIVIFALWDAIRTYYQDDNLKFNARWYIYTALRFPHYSDDPFAGKKIAEIEILQGDPYDRMQRIDKNITDPKIIGYLSGRLRNDKSTYFPGFFGTILPTQVYIDPNGDVITAVYCRSPEDRICPVTATKTKDGFLCEKAIDTYGKYDPEYVKSIALLTNISLNSK
jgi:hypothetical protein